MNIKHFTHLKFTGMGGGVVGGGVCLCDSLFNVTTYTINQTNTISKV